MNKTYILNVRSGHELFLHELFTKAGFNVYTPFETKRKFFKSRKARLERQKPTITAHPLFAGYLFVTSHLHEDEALTSMGYIMARHKNKAYSFMTHLGEVLSLTERQMDVWKAQLVETHKARRNFITRGYDVQRDARKNVNRLYGQDMITLPNFTIKDIVEFKDKSLSGLKAPICAIEDDQISVLLDIFGAKRKMTVSAFDLKKVG